MNERNRWFFAATVRSLIEILVLGLGGRQRQGLA